jgi:hypothetical protein
LEGGNGELQIEVARRGADTHQDARASPASHSSARFAGASITKSTKAQFLYVDFYTERSASSADRPLRLAARLRLLGTPSRARQSGEAALAGGLFRFSGTDRQPCALSMPQANIE